MTDIQVLKEFKNSLISFFDELIEQFPAEADLVMIRIFLKDQIPIEEVLNIFIYNLNKDNQKLKLMIKDRDESAFLDNNIFESLNKNKINHFKNLWRSGTLDTDDKNIIFKWMDSFIYLADKYNKIKSDSKTEKK
jgi:hypothetical protein